MKTGSLRVLGDLDTGDKTWVRIYENILAAAATSVTISGLTGNTDVEYRLVIRMISNASGSDLKVFPNNDTTLTNYGFQSLHGSDTATGAGRLTNNTYHDYTGTDANNSALFDIAIYAKSVFLRTMISSSTCNINGTTVTDVTVVGNVWNNTVNEITSLVVSAVASDGLGIGTSIELWTLR